MHLAIWLFCLDTNHHIEVRYYTCQSFRWGTEMPSGLFVTTLSNPPRDNGGSNSLISCHIIRSFTSHVDLKFVDGGQLWEISSLMKDR